MRKKERKVLIEGAREREGERERKREREGDGHKQSDLSRMRMRMIVTSAFLRSLHFHYPPYPSRFVKDFFCINKMDVI